MADDRQHRQQLLSDALMKRILVLDGAAGTTIQKHKLDEAAYRGDRFKDWSCDVQGNNDLLNITQPDIVSNMHKEFLEVGVDIIETNTFSSTTIAQADYAMEELTEELNLAGAKLARAAADEYATEEKPRFVAGAMGPTNRAGSLSPDVNDPGARNVDFDELHAAYKQEVRALIEGGVDLLLLETITDTLNAKAAIYAMEDVFEEAGFRVPLMISVMIPDQSGRTLSGQTPEGFWNSVRHAHPLTIGVNCSLGPDLMRPYVADFSKFADTFVCAYPNAGLPNAFGEYDETPEMMAKHVTEWAEAGLINVIGGCCGTTPDHIAAFVKAVEGKAPRQIPDIETAMRLSGLEPFKMAG